MSEQFERIIRDGHIDQFLKWTPEEQAQYWSHAQQVFMQYIAETVQTRSELQAALAAQAARADDIERQLHAEKRAYARLEKNHAVTVDAMCAYREERTQAERREQELREALVGIVQATDVRAKNSLGVCPICIQPSSIHAKSEKCQRNRARAVLAATVEAEPSAGQPPQTVDVIEIITQAFRGDYPTLMLEDCNGEVVTATFMPSHWQPELESISATEKTIEAAIIAAAFAVRQYQPAPPTARDDEGGG